VEIDRFTDRGIKWGSVRKENRRPEEEKISHSSLKD